MSDGRGVALLIARVSLSTANHCYLCEAGALNVYYDREILDGNSKRVARGRGKDGERTTDGNWTWSVGRIKVAK